MYISPTYSAVQDLTTQRDNYDQILQQVKDVAAKRDQVLASYNALSPNDLARLAKIVPPSFSSITFANHLNTVAGHHGLTVAKIQTTDQSASGQQVVAAPVSLYKTTAVTFSVKGPYSVIMAFMKDLESGLYLVDVTGLTMQKDSADKTGSSMDVTVSLNTYSIN